VTSVGLPLLETKIHVPRRRRGVVPRARLDQRFDRGDLPPVVLVSAPAGFGKTTLLTEWLAADEAPTAWVSLDRRDSDPAVFWSYVVAALQTVAPEVGADALALLQSSPSSLDAVVATLVNDLAALPGDIVLVLDDYHVVESRPVQESMLVLVEHLPPQLHLVVGSRADPPWPLAGLRARGELLEVRAADLRFAAPEAAAYLNEVMGLDLAAADIEALEARTEGWIAALQLAALSLVGRDDPGSFIAGFAGDDRFVVDYLVDEVLDRQPDDVRAFLLETSILSRLSAPVCAAVTGRTDARAALEALDRSNLFLVALDDRRRWYRYHHLFGDVLRSRLADEGPERVAELHRRAGEWFEADGDRSEAVRHTLAAGDVERAAELVELGIPLLRQTRQDATQRAWLDALPPHVFEHRPLLVLARVGARMVAGAVDGVAPLLDQLEAAFEDGHLRPGMVALDLDELRRVPTQVAMYRAALALLGGDLAEARACGARAAELSGGDDHVGLGAASALLGLAHWAEGDLAPAEDRYAASIAAFERADHLADILGCSLGLADVQFARGHLGDAVRTLTAGLEVATAHAPLRGTADMHVGLAELHLERDELRAAAEHLQASLDAGEHLALAQHAHRWRVVDARLRAIAGDLPGALARLDEAARHYDTDYSPRVRPVPATAARVRLAAGDVEGARQWADRSGLAADDDADHLREHEHLTLARVLVATGRAADAVPLLGRVLDAAEAGGRDGSAVEALLLLALAHDALGDATRALTTVEAALTRAAVEGWVRVFLDAGVPMTALLRSAVRHGRAAELATSILAAAHAPPAARPSGLVDELSARELDVLRLLRTDLTGPEIAAELIVSLNTVRTHTKHIFTKLGVTNRRAAVRRADELGL
jgi:LuxR family maltose regulon positive regulatory protein